MSLITLASLNLHGGLTSQRQPFDVAAACHSLKADVIALQEAWWPDGQPDPFSEIAAALGAEVRRRGLAHRTSRAQLRVGDDAGSGTWGLAVLTTLPVTAYTEIELGRAPGDRISRAAQVLTLATPEGGALRVVNTHLTHRFTSLVQLGVLDRRLAAATSPAGPGATVIAGDLNMPRAAALLVPGYRPVVRGRTFPADRPLIQLDHLLIRGRVTASGGEVLDPVGSDHLPIRAQLTLA
jgi:endonuclease/exonuclease/phosphatase family metal-dependent hydrolase